MAVVLKIDMDAVDARLRHGELWTAGWGDPTNPDAPTCLHGAIRYCQPIPGDARIIEQVGCKFGFGTTDNDRQSDWAHVKALVVPDITDEMLAATFGPQWEPIVALVRRCATMTVVEAEALAAAGAAAWDAAWAARAAARDAAWAAVRDAAWAARAAAGAAARDAARALAVRDLIGRHGFMQAHYDTLTGPWAKVIGPVHLNDTVPA